MTGYERIHNAINGKQTDKIPIMLHNFMMAAEEHGVTMEQYRNNPRTIAGTFIASIEKYHYDGIVVDIDTVTLAGALGMPVDFPINDPARPAGNSIENLDDLLFSKTRNIQDYKYIQIWLEAVFLLKEYFKDEIYIRGNCDQAPFSLASMIYGTQNWMIGLLTAEESKISMVLEYCTEACAQFIMLMTQTGCHMVSNGDSTAGPEMISADMYFKYALPYERKIADIAHNAGAAYTLHICGNTNVILKHMLDCGADAIELDYKTDISKIYEIFHDSRTLIGNIDPSGVLALGSKKDVQRKTLELLSVYKDSNRFILNAGCAIPPNTPSENLKMMIDTARNFK